MKAVVAHRPGRTRAATGSNRTVKCAFCAGTGRDPFAILSPGSRCPVCRGQTTLALAGPAVPCAYCRGTGRQRHARLACSGCRGAGVIPLYGPAKPCLQCHGTGREPQGDLPCSLCRGAGVLGQKPPPMRRRR
jgi:DnaJ-class molecular chaperone